MLDTLHYCMKVDTEQALKAGAMDVFTTLLKHDSWEIRGKAARDIMDIRFLYNKNLYKNSDTWFYFLELLI